MATCIWEKQVSDWLKADQGGACHDVAILGNDVWLYVNDAGDLIGVGSLGDAQASWPTNSKPREPAACITWLGIDRRFQKKGFGQQILDDLLNYVYSTTSYRLVTLVVHVDNKPAHEWYRKNNFTTIGKPFTLDGHSYQRMVINIRQDK